VVDTVEQYVQRPVLETKENPEEQALLVKYGLKLAEPNYS